MGGSAGVVVEYLTGHDAHAVTVSASAGHTADAFSIVVYCRDYPGTMCSVSRILLRRPRYRPVFHEVESVNIIYIAIAVIVIAVRAFLRVGPHVGRKVRVSVFHSFIHHGHDNGRVTGSYLFPDILHIDISPRVSGSGNVLVSGILVVPLVLQGRVIELAGSGHQDILRLDGVRKRLTVRGFLIGDAVLDGLHRL